MSTTFKKGWYVLYVKSRCEKKVAKLLQDGDLIAFLPLVKTVRKWSDRQKIIEAPLFPSYVFVRINSKMDFYRALSIEGACAYVQFGREYARVLDNEIDQIRTLLGTDDVLDIGCNSQVIKVGEIKKIEYGPLSGLECEMLKVNNENKIVVRIHSIQQNIIATVPSNYFTVKKKYVKEEDMILV